MRTRSPTRSTDPSITASTCSALAISGRGFLTRLYCMTEVREITRSALILERSAISASVIPSAKYSWSGSREKFSSGRTARDEMRGVRFRLSKRSRQSPTLSPKSTASKIAKAATEIHLASRRLAMKLRPGLSPRWRAGGRRRLEVGTLPSAKSASCCLVGSGTGGISVSSISIRASPRSRRRR